MWRAIEIEVVPIYTLHHPVDVLEEAYMMDKTGNDAIFSQKKIEAKAFPIKERLRLIQRPYSLTSTNYNRCSDFSKKKKNGKRVYVYPYVVAISLHPASTDRYSKNTARHRSGTPRIN